jgi:hypothetical protein
MYSLGQVFYWQSRKRPGLAKPSVQVLFSQGDFHTLLSAISEQFLLMRRGDLNPKTTPQSTPLYRACWLPQGNPPQATRESEGSAP